MKQIKERKTKFTTDSGIEIPPYLENDSKEYKEKLNTPGKYPFTRGVHEIMSKPLLDNAPVCRIRFS